MPAIGAGPSFGADGGHGHHDLRRVRRCGRAGGGRDRRDRGLDGEAADGRPARPGRVREALAPDRRGAARRAARRHRLVHAVRQVDAAERAGCPRRRTAVLLERAACACPGRSSGRIRHALQRRQPRLRDLPRPRARRADPGGARQGLDARAHLQRAGRLHDPVPRVLRRRARRDAGELRGDPMTNRLVARYLVASTVILFASGLLGVLIRESQAGVGKLGDNTWYALMTAHGLGAFLGWAGFAVMGLSFWVLDDLGYELRPLGRFFAEATWWLMVLGVAGVLVSTLVMHFAGSWVFLYPLPFHGAGEWGRWATAVFSFSVLLAGLSIVTWCLGILHTVVGPALHAVSRSVLGRLGVALGLGYLWPKRFATNPRPVAYPVIPLTVIGIDMIIATLPLAVLLVEMIVQSFSPSVTVDPLLAKNVLWFFGHPVVYLLLFPAVAIYYLLIPRYAKKPLVAGNAIAVAWLMAVVVNVIIWAHHVYLDYPTNSIQSGLDTISQPLTFSITLVSALSLFSLSATIWRSEFEWTIGA